ncbi:MAG: hypothetical protein HC771_16755 [Synechococcales cyanobacterium CRU_2_2]|nr:hypothetical protein [Synechococcales cyanobacterium CRU_2_2]
MKVGARVTLRGAGHDGAFGTADDVVRTQITASAGYCGFGNLVADLYKVTVDNLPGRVELTQANVGGNDNIDSDLNGDGIGCILVM